MNVDQAPHQSKAKLLDAALRVVRAKGYNATTVDDLCDAAGVSKGSFFHHFKTKEELAISAAAHFGAMADRLFSGAPYRTARDPRDRVLGYVDFRIALISDDVVASTCLFGTMVQETFETHPAVAAACKVHLSEHVDMLANDIRDAKRLYAADAPWDPRTLSSFIQAVLQGAFILVKAENSPTVGHENLAHLRRYIEMLLPAKKVR
jgi:TetR/AcrR family transcriptional regulator, transcriptional repressor for nem operon